VESNSQPEKNRRAARRRAAKRSVKITCVPSPHGLGANVAVALQDVSEAGARLIVRVPITPGQEVEVSFVGVGHRKPVKTVAEVIWCVPTPDSTYHLGLRFQRYLTYQDLQELGS
jgi:hypothetical protein